MAVRNLMPLFFSNCFKSRIEINLLFLNLYSCREFCNMVRRIFICSSQDVKKMSKGSKLPMASIEGEGTVISSGSAEN